MECINDQCSNVLTGRQKTYCSDKCRMQQTRTNPNTNNPNSKPEQLTADEIAKRGCGAPEPTIKLEDQPTIHELAAANQINQPNLDQLPDNVTPPTGHRTASTADMTAGELRRKVSAYHGRKWIASPEYCEVIYRLLTMTVEELQASGQHVPAWKMPKKKETAA